VIFATLEDETGVVNVIVWPDVFARQRKVLLGARLLGVEGPLQREGLVIHVIAKRLVDLSPRLEQLSAPGFDRTAREAGDARALYPSRNFR
jgi:error-prone DNA polymerase